MSDKITVYMIECSSYSGCEGWYSYMQDEVYRNIEDAQAWIAKHRSDYIRYAIVKKVI